jgi:K+/H+ antiporter YhaU regulatory subunit KhtT
MVVTDAGIVTVVKLEQFQKAPSPMYVTESDIETVVKLEHPKKV